MPKRRDFYENKNIRKLNKTRRYKYFTGEILW